MRSTGRCRGFALALAATFIGGAFTLELEEGREVEGCFRPKVANDPIHDWQTPCIPGLGQKAQRLLQKEGISKASLATLIVTLPKITPAPLARRKLGSNKWDSVHEGLQAQKRDGETCSSGYQLCPQSLNGGCCPNGRICGADSCLPASSSTPVACGKTGYAPCGIDDGGGCCPIGYACGRTGCSPSVGVTHTETCGASSYLCPASMNYGCCKNGFGCGLESCFATSISTFTFTQTITTTDSNDNSRTFTSTVTSTVTPSAPAASVATEAGAGAVPKAFSTPTSIPKTESSGGDKSSDGGGGLTRTQIGGIIGGAVGLLFVILIAAFIIIRRLNKTISVVDANSRTRKSSSAPSKSRNRPPRRGADLDAMSIDPLMMTPSETSEFVGSPPPHIPAIQEADGSPVFRSPFSPPYATYAGHRGYNAVATSDQNYYSNVNSSRSGSVESTPPMAQIAPGGYFDIPTRIGPDHDPRNARYERTNYQSSTSQGRRPSYHGRNWSNASDQSQGADATAELDAGKDGDRRSHLQRALQGMGLGRMGGRRRSEPVQKKEKEPTMPIMEQAPQKSTVLTGGPARTDWSPPVLGHILEAGESKVSLSGRKGKNDLGLGITQQSPPGHS